MKSYKEIYKNVSEGNYETWMQMAKKMAKEISHNNDSEIIDIKIQTYEYLDEMFGIWYDPTVEEDKILEEYIGMLLI